MKPRRLEDPHAPGRLLGLVVLRPLGFGAAEWRWLGGRTWWPLDALPGRLA